MELTLTSPPGRREGTSWVYQSWQRWVILFWHSSKTENYIWIYLDRWWTAKSIKIWYIYTYIDNYLQMTKLGRLINIDTAPIMLKLGTWTCLSCWLEQLGISMDILYSIHLFFEWSQLLIGPPWLFTFSEGLNLTEIPFMNQRLQWEIPRRSRFEWEIIYQLRTFPCNVWSKSTT